MGKCFLSIAGLGFLSLLPLLAGCSHKDEGFVLKGTVSYQGHRLDSGVVRLHMPNRMAMAMIQPDGTFSATDVFPGENVKVTIGPAPGSATQMAMPPSKLPPGAPAGASQPKSSSTPIPAKYRDVQTTDLVFTIKNGEPLNIDLK